MAHSAEKLESVARAFFDLEGLFEARPAGAGNINDTFRIDFQEAGEKRNALLQRLNHQVFKDPDGVMHNIRTVAEYLERQPGFPLQAPAPVPTRSGQWLYRIDGEYWRVFPFYEHTYAPENLPTPSVAYEAAQAYGTFLCALRDFPIDGLRETIPGFHDTDRRWEAFIHILEKDPVQRVAQTQKEIELFFHLKTTFERISSLKRNADLPLRVTHNDTKAGNVLLDTETGRAVAVIDWDTIMPGTVLSDFGDMVRTFAPSCPEDDPGTPVLRLDTLEMLCRGFLEQTSGLLTEAERRHLPLGALWMVGEQALRFFTDYLAGDTYYKVRYPEHNLIRTRNQLGLFREMERQLEFFGKMLLP